MGKINVCNMKDIVKGAKNEIQNYWGVVQKNLQWSLKTNLKNNNLKKKNSWSQKKQLIFLFTLIELQKIRAFEKYS